MDSNEKGDLQRRFGDGFWYGVAMSAATKLPSSREKSLMLTKLEEAMHWEQAAVRQGN